MAEAFNVTLTQDEVLAFVEGVTKAQGILPIKGRQLPQRMYYDSNIWLMRAYCASRLNEKKSQEIVELLRQFNFREVNIKNYIAASKDSRTGYRQLLIDILNKILMDQADKDGSNANLVEEISKYLNEGYFFNVNNSSAVSQENESLKVYSGSVDTNAVSNSSGELTHGNEVSTKYGPLQVPSTALPNGTTAAKTYSIKKETKSDSNATLKGSSSMRYSATIETKSQAFSAELNGFAIHYSPWGAVLWTECQAGDTLLHSSVKLDSKDEVNKVQKTFQNAIELILKINSKSRYVHVLTTEFNDGGNEVTNSNGVKKNKSIKDEITKEEKIQDALQQILIEHVQANANFDFDVLKSTSEYDFKAEINRLLHLDEKTKHFEQALSKRIEYGGLAKQAEIRKSMKMERTIKLFTSVVIGSFFVVELTKTLSEWVALCLKRTQYDFFAGIAKSAGNVEEINHLLHDFHTFEGWGAIGTILLVLFVIGAQGIFHLRRLGHNEPENHASHHGH